MAYVSLPAARVPGNAMLDFRPLVQTIGANRAEQRQNAMDVRNQQRQAQIDHRAAESHGWAREDRASKEQTAYTQRVGQYFQNVIEPEKDQARRKSLVDGWIASHPAVGEKLAQYGIRPDDTEGVIRLVRSEATPYMTPKDQADLQRVQAQTAAERAREEHYRAQADQRRAPKTVIDSLSEVPSKTEWETPRVQSIIQAAWGQPVPWERRGEFLQATGGASSFAGGDPFMPTTDEAELGITREMKMEAARSQKLGEMYGKKGEQKEGYRYDIVDGQVQQVPTTEKAQQLKKQKAQLDFYQNQLSSAEKVLTNAGFIERTVGIGLDRGEAGQAAADWENAVLGLVYEKSGKQTAVAEMRQWLSTFGPKVGDTAWRVKQKLQRTRDFYKALTGEDMEGEKEDPNKRRLYDKYGLE